MSDDRPAWSDDDAERLRALTTEFLAREAAPRLSGWAEQGYVDPEFWVRAGQRGLLCASIPRRYGGGGGSMAHEIAIVEEVGRAGAHCFGNLVHSGIVAHYLLSLGSETQKHRWLPAMADGSKIGSLAMTEPSTGSDVAGIRTRAIRDGADYVLNGSKTFISNGGTCGLVVVAAKTEPAAEARGVSLLVVEADTPGFRRGRLLKKIGMHGQDTAELFFDDVRVPADHLLGQENRGFEYLMINLRQERLLVAVEALVEAEQALETAIEHCTTGNGSGEPRTALQHVRFRLAECATLVAVTRTFVDDCIVRLLRNDLDEARASMAKYWSTEAQGRVVEQLLDLFGEQGCLRDQPIGRMFTDARFTRIAGGTNEIMKELISRAL